MSMQSYGSNPRKRRFAVTVDGVRHEVIVEELDGDNGSAADAPAVPPLSEASPETADNGIDPDGWIVAPMPGTVTEIAVGEGDTVKAGDVILILTAMKLENEITAPVDGIVGALAIAAGDNVNSADRLLRLDGEAPTS